MGFKVNVLGNGSPCLFFPFKEETEVTGIVWINWKHKFSKVKYLYILIQIFLDTIALGPLVYKVTIYYSFEYIVTEEINWG